MFFSFWVFLGSSGVPSGVLLVFDNDNTENPLSVERVKQWPNLHRSVPSGSYRDGEGVKFLVTVIYGKPGGVGACSL